MQLNFIKSTLKAFELLKKRDLMNNYTFLFSLYWSMHPKCINALYSPSSSTDAVT